MSRPRSARFSLDDVVRVMVAREAGGHSLASAEVAEDLDTTRYTLCRRIREWTGQDWETHAAPYLDMHVLHAGYADIGDPEGMKIIKALVPAAVEDELHVRAAQARTSVAAIAGRFLADLVNPDPVASGPTPNPQATWRPR